MMKTKGMTLFTVTLALLCGGCVGTGPNTQQGAVAGGALGAIAGAIIGNNSGHGNGAQGALIGAAAGAILGGTMGNQADHERGTIYGSEAEATTQSYAMSPPPAPQRPSEIISPQPAPEAVWIQGYWAYASRGYAWVPGHWEIPPPERTQYVSAHWQRQGNQFVFINGYWR
jgi:hypothetical protein